MDIHSKKMHSTEISTLKRIQEKYTEKFGSDSAARTFRSPGRINLIGEHTDYNNGFVLPAAVDKAVYFVIAPRNDDKVILYAVDLDDTYEFSIDDLAKPEADWTHYQLSILDQLKKHNLTAGGFQAVFGGDVPVGAGLSSSAALECCLLFALNEMNDLKLDRFDIVKMAQKAENEYVGVQCGIMDQFASAFGKEESVIRLDCRSLEYQYFPFPMNDYLLVLCDTKVKHSLANSEYNTRRLECEEGIAYLQQFDSSIQSLRDVNPHIIYKNKQNLRDEVYRRCKFITEEIERVQIACEHLTEGDMESFGKKMYETHAGLQHEYEVSCPELDFLVEQTKCNDYVLGARMMGGGFGGCTINLIKAESVDEFESGMRASYLAEYGIELPCYRVRITNGTSEII